MKPSKIILEGFGSYSKRTVVRLDNPGITLLSGLNGSGKSTIGMAIVWALTGKTVEGVGKSEIMHMYETLSFCRVEFFYSLGENNCQVIRIREAGKSGERLLYHFNGKRFEGAAVKETQERIFSDIGVPENLFGSLFLLSRINAQEFMLSDSSRKKWIEQLFDADFSEYYKKVGIEFSRAATEISTKREDFSRIRYEISGRERTIKDLKEEKERHLAANKEDTEVKIAEFREELRTSRELIRARTTEYSVLFDVVQRSEDYIAAIPKQEKEFQILQQKIATISPVADACRTCSVYQKSCGEQEGLLTSIETARTVLVEAQKTKELFIQRSTQLHGMRSAIDQLSMTEKRIEAQIEILKKREVRDETKGITAKIVSIEKEIEFLSKEGFAVSFDIVSLSERITVLEFWRNAFGNKGVKNFLMDMLRPKLQAYSNATLQKISPELSIGFPTSTILKSGEIKETDFPVLIFFGGKEIEYKSLSIGQQGRIDFALLFGRRKLLESWKGISIEFLFLDDFFSAMDFHFISSALELVKEENTPVFVAHPEEADGVPQVLREKVNRVIEVSLVNHSTILKEEK